MKTSKNSEIKKTEPGRVRRIIRAVLKISEQPDRRVLSAVLVFCLLLLPASAAHAQTAFDFSGMVKLFLSVYASSNQAGPYFFHDSGDFAFKRLEGRFRLKAQISDNVSACIRLDAFSSPDAVFSGQSFPEAGILASPGKTEPFELSLYEAYIRVNHFLLKNLDLTVGKQRIQWGTADKLNIIDNLNPVDFANFLTFDPDYYLERRPQTAFNLEFYPWKNSKLQLVWLLGRQYSPLPAGFEDMLRANLTALPSPEINLATETSSLRNTNFGARLSTTLFNVDLGLSYYNGNYTLPYIQGVEISSPFQPAPTQVYFRYPKKQVLGLDLAGEIKSVGFWAELARVQPQKILGWLDTYLLIGGELFPLNAVFPLLDSYYWQWVVGADYTFSVADGLYVNFQYLHGLFDEASFSGLAESYFGLRKGMWFGQVQDYLAGRAELRMLKGDLKAGLNTIFSPSSGEFSRSSAIFYPTLEYRVHDAVSVQAGAILATGDGSRSKFGNFSRDRVVYLLTKLSF
ncbi:MAG: hypothetical protein OP8BY_1041 [Candidatus Saccharicenans subterraneus]|uniref:Uncharacterized protein n=1 Tax=Candidatus Saccharicenans subterraneus TaxID=2508984 RepID=A0A3E2BQU8_9BACT|nr:MAG: hypothetical protein OP8BY_1041 [Candidatus Saccharicenans subterraneum]